MQDLLQFICKNGFEHHVAINLSRVASILMKQSATTLELRLTGTGNKF